jgi:hypothetical protein
MLRTTGLAIICSIDGFAWLLSFVENLKEFVLVCAKEISPVYVSIFNEEWG